MEIVSVVDFNVEKGLRSVFIEISVEFMWEVKYCLREGKESWESLVYNFCWNVEWSEELFIDNEDGDNKVIVLKLYCLGVMR